MAEENDLWNGVSGQLIQRDVISAQSGSNDGHPRLDRHQQPPKFLDPIDLKIIKTPFRHPIGRIRETGLSWVIRENQRPPSKKSQRTSDGADIVRIADAIQ